MEREDLEGKSREELINLCMQLDRKLFDVIKEIAESEADKRRATAEEIARLEKEGRIVRSLGEFFAQKD